MEFLYFPDDKSEYIPGIIVLLIFALGAVVTMYFILKVSKKEEKKADEKYHMNQMNHKTDNNNEE